MNMLASLRKKEPRSDLYKAGYAMGTTAGMLIGEYMTPPAALFAHPRRARRMVRRI